MKSSGLNLKRTFAIVTVLFIVVAAITCTVGFANYKLLRISSQQTDQLTNRNLPALQALAKLEEATLRYNAAHTEFVLAKDEAAMAAKARAGDEWAAQIIAQLGRLGELVRTPESVKLEGALKDSLTIYQAAAVRLQTALRAGDFEKAMATLDNDVAKSRLALDATLTALSQHY